MYQRFECIGNVGNAPELRRTQSGMAVCNFNIATNEVYKNEAGQKVEHTEWHRVVVWGPQAENVSRYVQKGRRLFVEGRIRHREFTDRNGEVQRTTEVVADTVKFLEAPTGNRRPEAPPAPPDVPDDANEDGAPIG